LPAFDEGKRREWLTRLVQDASNPHRDTYNWAMTLRSNGLLIGWLVIGGTHQIIAECETQNIASARVMQKCGMEYEGMFYDADFEEIWANRYRYKITARMLETL
jgi:hypothetical protein